MGVAEGVVVCIAVLVGSGVMRVVVGDGAGVVDGTARRKLSRRACCGPRTWWRAPASWRAEGWSQLLSSVVLLTGLEVLEPA